LYDKATLRQLNRKGDVLRVTRSSEQPVHIAVSFDLHDDDTDESVKSKIRRHLQSVLQGGKDNKDNGYFSK
jgi:hypothetical protein